MRDNSLLVAQQLDQVFKKLEQGLADGSAQTHTFRDIVRVFYLYDRRFVEQNQFNVIAKTETAYATQRVAQCALLLGELKDSLSHYRRAERRFEAILSADPGVVACFHDWIDAQVNIAILENETGNAEASKRQFDQTMRLIEQSTIPPSIDFDEWMVPQYRRLAELGTDLMLYTEALKFARRFEESASRLAEVSSDQMSREMASEARKYVAAISQLVRQQP